MQKNEQCAVDGNAKPPAWLAGLFAAGLMLAGLQLPAAEGDTTTDGTNTTPAVAEATAPAPANDFSAFEIISDRNIFDPNRRARARQTTRDSEPEKPPRVDVIALAGTMSYGDQELAFFDSNASEFKKTLKPGESVAGYTVRQVAQNHVELERESAKLELKVGQQLRRVEDGEWQVTSGIEISTATGRSRDRHSPGVSARGSTEAGTTTTTTTVSPGDASDALKRLLEKRRNESAQ